METKMHLLTELEALKKQLRESIKLESVGDIAGHVKAHNVYYRVRAACEKTRRLFEKHNMSIARSGFLAGHD